MTKSDRSARQPWLRAVITAATVALAPAACGPHVDEASLPSLPDIAAERFLDNVKRQLADARAGVDAAPLDARANGNLGMVLAAYRLDEAAETALRRARMLAPREPRWVYYHGVALARLGRSGEAEAAFDRAASLDDYPNTRLRLARIYLETNRVASAVTTLEAVLAEKPDLVAARMTLGRALLRAGDPVRAAAEFEKVIAAAGPVGAAYFGLAESARRRGDSEAARAYLELSEAHRDVEPPVDDPLMAAVQDLDRTDNRLFRDAQARHAAGDSAGAVELLSDAIARNADALAARAALVWLLGDLGRFDAAEAAFREAEAIEAGFAQLHLAIGRTRVSAGQLEAAEAALARAASLDPHRADIAMLRGRVLTELGRHDEALASFRAAHRAEPNDRDAGRRYAEALGKAGRHADAAAVLRRQTGGDESARDWRMLGDAERALGNRDAALAAYEAGLAVARTAGDPRAQAVLEHRLDALARDAQETQ